jgi:hypothetical protein
MHTSWLSVVVRAVRPNPLLWWSARTARSLRTGVFFNNRFSVGCLLQLQRNRDFIVGCPSVTVGESGWLVWQRPVFSDWFFSVVLSSRLISSRLMLSMRCS